LRAFRERLQREFALERLQRVERRGGRIPVNGILRRIGCTRGLLIGDAAGAVSPLTAGGLDPCLRLTRLAVAHAAEYLEGGAAASLEAYSGAPFQRHFMSRLLLRRALNASRHPALAELALLLLGGPFRALAAKVFFGRGSFPDIELATARVARSTAQRQEAVLQYPLRRTTTLPRR
jgi:flavin-dependent dehydrogenase